METLQQDSRSKQASPESRHMPGLRSKTIRVSAPYPLLDPGDYQAECVEATLAWARQWRKWMARLVMKPLNYNGRFVT